MQSSRLPTCVLITATFLTAFPFSLDAQEKSAREVLQAEVSDCTSRALSGDLGPLEFLDWVGSCRQRSEELCALHSRTNEETSASGPVGDSCDDHSRAAWKGVADTIKAKLIDRWRTCAVPKDVKSALIDKIEETDAAVYALFASNCSYDAAQWQAFGEPEIALSRSKACEADAEAIRSTVHYQNLIRDAGCGTPLAEP